MARAKKPSGSETEKQRKERILANRKRPNAGAPEWPFEKELAEEICFKISTSTDRLDKILKSEDRFPSKDVFYKWLFKSVEFKDMYQHARELQQEILVDSQVDELQRARMTTYTDKEGNERIDGAAVSLASLACANIKWEAARRDKRKFGDNRENSPTPEDERLNMLNEAVAKKRASKKREY
jgi:hypothetical protein